MCLSCSNRWNYSRVKSAKSQGPYVWRFEVQILESIIPSEGTPQWYQDVSICLGCAASAGRVEQYVMFTLPMFLFHCPLSPSGLRKSSTRIYNKIFWGPILLQLVKASRGGRFNWVRSNEIYWSNRMGSENFASSEKVPLCKISSHSGDYEAHERVHTWDNCEILISVPTLIPGSCAASCSFNRRPWQALSNHRAPQWQLPRQRNPLRSELVVMISSCFCGKTKFPQCL